LLRSWGIVSDLIGLSPYKHTHTLKYDVLVDESFLKSQYCNVNESPRFEKVAKKIEVTFKEYIHGQIDVVINFTIIKKIILP